MTYALLVLLIVSALPSGFAARWTDQLRVVFLAPLYVAFTLLYVLADDQLAQDRHEYFRWYVQAHDHALSVPSNDALFSAFLAFLPSALGVGMFGLVLSSTVFILLLAVLASLAFQRAISWQRAALVLLVVICDRLFLDGVFNTTRSSIALLLALFALTLRGRLRYILAPGIWLVAFGIHGRLVVVLLVLYVVSAVFARTPRLLLASVLSGIMIFAIRAIESGPLLPDWILNNTFAATIDSESWQRGLSTRSELSVSLILQVFLGLITPLIILVFGRATRSAPGWANEREHLIMSFALVTATAGLVMYPEMALSQRVFIVPLLILPLALGLRHLKWLVVVKLGMLALFLPAHLG